MWIDAKNVDANCPMIGPIVFVKSVMIGWFTRMIPTEGA